MYRGTSFVCIETKVFNGTACKEVLELTSCSTTFTSQSGEITLKFYKPRPNFSQYSY